MESVPCFVRGIGSIRELERHLCELPKTLSTWASQKIRFIVFITFGAFLLDDYVSPASTQGCGLLKSFVRAVILSPEGKRSPSTSVESGWTSTTEGAHDFHNRDVGFKGDLNSRKKQIYVSHFGRPRSCICIAYWLCFRFCLLGCVCLWLHVKGDVYVHKGDVSRDIPEELN